MDNGRNAERKVFSCPELDCEDHTAFPEASEEEFAAMESSYAEDPSMVCLYPFVREPADGKPYIELYFWDSMLYLESYKRFVIAEGFRMTEMDETDFLRYTGGGLFAYQDTTETFLETADRLFPGWHLSGYDAGRIREALEHMYFASHRSGPREILYKAGLGNIAYHLDDMSEYNILGTTPAEIIGHGITLGMLRILNQPEFVREIEDSSSIESFGEVYRKYGGHIGGEAVSRGQWKYLAELSSGRFIGGRFSRALYGRLEGDDGEIYLRLYKEFLSLKREFPEARKMKLPDRDELMRTVEHMKEIKRYRSRCAGLDKRFAIRKKAPEYEYRDKQFFVTMPENSFDLCREAIYQGNCVMDYIEGHAKGTTTILFLRKTAEPRIPYVTMEVCRQEILQVYGRFNSLPAKEVYTFLEKYAKEKELVYDPYALIMEGVTGLDDEDLSDALLWEYAEEYKERTGKGA